MLLVVCLAVFGVAAKVVAAETVIRHFHTTGQGAAWAEWVQEQAEDFNRQGRGVRVEVTLPAGAFGEEQFLTLYAGGVQMDVTEHTLANAGGLAAQGLFTDLRPFYARSRNIRLDAFPSVAVQAMTWTDGTIWGVPADLYVVPTSYHQEMFAAAGLLTPLEIEDDWTFDTLLDVSKKLTRDLDGNGTIDQWASNSAGVFLFQSRGGFDNRDAPLFDRPINPTKVLFDTPPVIAALEWIADLYLVHNVIGPQPSDSTGFLTGKVGWTLANGPNTALEMAARGDAAFEWGLALPPKGTKRGAMTAVNSFQVPKTCKHPEAVWTWLEFLLGSQEGWNRFVSATGRLPANLQAMRRWPTVMKGKLSNLPEGLDTYIRAAVHLDTYIQVIGPGASRIIRNLAPPVVRKVCSGAISATQGMRDLQQQASPLLVPAQR